uniref:Gliding motility protein SprA N-terminal domain-containing protein n=1 Tax=candidate division WOR-3 bacterium TaxID=2052148 RepID=A0A7C6AG62_UNCW3
MTLFLILLINQFTQPYEIKTFVTSDAQYIIYARFYQGELISIDSIVPMSSYLSLGLKKKNQQFLLKELQSDLIKKGGYANKGLFGTFEVPLPKGGFSDFMGETGKLDVGGYIKITLGGTETFYSNLPPDQQRTSLLPELKMEQEMAVNLDGEVGDRMKVFIDHNSTRVDENENKIRVTYKGKEDEILQELEGGDTQLSIPGTSYTGDIPSHQGLFGLKSTAKLGPVDIVAIASREQTQFSEQEITGGAESMPDTIWARDYQKRQFFWLGTNDSIIELRIFVDDGNPANNNNGITRYAYAYLDLNDDNVPDDTTEKEEGYFTLRYEGPDQDYQFFGRRVNIIELKNSLYNNIEALGVYYRKINNQGKEDTVGFVGADTFRLKLICPRTFRPTSLTWKYYELKNYYRIGSPGGTVDTIRIYHNVANGIDEDIYQNKTLISTLGLDNDNNNVVDPYNGYGGFDYNRGLLIFPEPTPFINTNLPEPDSEVYTNPYYAVGQDKYYIYTKSVQVKRIFSIPFNTKRVKVYINDVLVDSSQYVVDYTEGKLEFLRPLSVTDRVRIQAEYSTLFSLSQKSLIGLRANSKIFGEGNLGSSFFYRTESYQTAPYEHIRLNEEPYNRMVWEADCALPGKIPYLTELIDNLPLIQTETESKFNINVEGAYSFSNINSQNAVYLDDFEATTINHAVTLTKSYWHLCSKPVNQDTGNFAQKRIIWYNPPSKNVFRMQDIYNNPTDPQAIAEVLQIKFTPDNQQSFAGLTQYITNTNLDECENIELIVNGKGGKMHIEVAEEISEDQLRRNKKGELVGINTFEDEDNAPRNFSWDAVNEDRGLDNVTGNDAQNVSGDDGNDDFTDEDYSGGINGTEGNRIWDTEDIDRNGIFNLSSNIYHSFSVHLDSTRFLVEGGLKNGWKMFRIPLKDSLARDTVFGTINWQNIKFVRIWFDNFSQPETIYIHKLSLTGSRWKNYGIATDDSLNPVDTTEKFVITPVNTETHTYYKPPYPLPIDPLTGKTINEGGLEFNLLNIKENHTCIAYRRVETQEDYRGYDTLVFYFRTLHSNPEIALRFGSDSNYYEYKTNYESGMLGYNNWRKYTVVMANFPELKKKTGGVGKFTEGSYTVYGNPSLQNNGFFEVRITNQFTTPLTDTMWFNDIKLTSPQYEVGRIFRSNGSLNFADLSSITFAYSESNGKFKRLSESKGISTSGPGKNYGANALISLDKFLPQTWGFSIPLGLSYNRNIQEPRYSSIIASDIELDDSSRALEKSMSTVRGYNLSYSKSGSKNWLMKQTLDNLRLFHDRTISISNGAKNADTSDLRNYRGDYTISPEVSIKLLKQSISLLPQTITFGSVYTDNHIKSLRRDSLNQPFRTSPGYPQHNKTITPSFSTIYSPHKIISTSYNFAQTRDSVSEKWRFGEEVNRSQTFNSRISKDLIILNPSLQFASSYNEDHRFELRKPDRRGINNSSNISIGTTLDIKKIVKFFTHLRDESKDSLQIPGSPLWVLKQIETFVDLLQNPSLNFSRQKSSGYYSKVRPDLKYQFGLVDTIPTDQIDPNSYSSRSIGDNFSASSGISYKILSLNGSYSKQISRSFGYSGDENRSISESYPDANLRILNVEKVPILKKYAHNSSINISFSQNYQKLYRILPDTTPELTSDSKTLSLNPLLGWQVNWKRGITTNTSINYSETQSHQYSDVFINPSKSVNWGGSISFAYTFSAPGGISLPLLQGIRFASNLTTNLTYTYNRNTSYSASLEYPNELDMDNPVVDNENSNIDLSLSYNFSTSITGGATLNYSRNQDRVFNNSYRRVGLNIWANINF